MNLPYLQNGRPEDDPLAGLQIPLFQINEQGQPMP